MLRRVSLSDAVAVVLILATCYYFKDARWPENADLDKVMSVTHLYLPPSARLLHGNYIDSDCNCEIKYVRAKIGLPSADVAPFVTWLGKRTCAVSRIDRFGISDGIRDKPGCGGSSQPRHTWRTPAWWRPDSAHKFRAAMMGSATAPYEEIHVVVELDDPKQAVIYVNYMEH